MFLLEPAQPVEHLLDAADGKRRNDQLAATRDRIADDCRQFLPAVVDGVIAIAVRRFEEHQISGDGGLGIGQYRAAVTSEVATKENRRTAGEAGVKKGRPEQVPGHAEFDGEPVHDLDRLRKPDRLQLGESTEGIGLRIQRLRRIVLRVSVPVGLPGVLFLNARGVWQHEPAQILCAGGTEHTAAISLRDQPWQVTDVIEVRVRQHDRIDRRRIDRELLPVARAAAPSGPGTGRSR